MMDKIFNKDFNFIDSEKISLKIIDTYFNKDGDLPFYYWDIVLKSINKSIGKISFRIGSNYHSYFNGNIGYEIDEEYRGHNYAALACKLLFDVARYHKMKSFFITCDVDNIASYKTIEKIGGKLVEIVLPPKDYIYYFEGILEHRIYLIELDI